MAKNRISKPDDCEAAPDKIGEVKAYIAIAWTCACCRLQQFSERNTTHEEKCRRCGVMFLVRVKGTGNGA
jgi:hypothetical protein